MNDNHIYPKEDMFGYYGKDLWFNFAHGRSDLADKIVSVFYLMGTSTDPILSSSDHVEHKWFRMACLLGLAEWPDV